MDKVKPKTAVAKFLDSLSERVEPTIDKLPKAFISTQKKNYSDNLVCNLPSGKKIKFILKMVNPAKCKIWNGNIRINDFLNESTTQDLAERIKAQGQLVPVLARPIKAGEHTHEIIYGSRRHYVCSLLDIDLKVLEGDIDDKDALLFMDAENSGREAASIYETALAYKRWLEDSIFESQGELAKKMGISRTWVNKIISLSKIPLDIIKAFSNPNDVSIKMGLEIVEKISNAKNSINEMIKIAKELEPLKLEPQVVLNKLLNMDPVKRKHFNNSNSQSKIIYSLKGIQICKISTSRAGKTMIIFSQKLAKDKIDTLLDEFEKIVSKKVEIEN